METHAATPRTHLQRHKKGEAGDPQTSQAPSKTEELI